MSKANIYKERIKTILLVVLFITAVLLSYLYWKDAAFLDIKQTMDNSPVFTALSGQTLPEPEEFIAPSRIDVSFGDGTYTSCRENVREIWSRFLPYYIDFTRSKGLSVESLSEEQWNNIMGFRSFRCVFDYALPDSFFRHMGASNVDESDHFSSLRELGFSQAFDDSFFIRSGDGSCFRVRASEYDSSGVLAAIDALKAENADQYYPMNQFLGSDNTLITPFSTDIRLPALQLRSAAVPDSGFETGLARDFFGQSLDFIRTVTDNNGTTIFMYSYGETTLTVYKNGFFEYQDTPVVSDSSVGFTEAFRTASAFIAEHGSWSAHDGETIHFLLEDVSRSRLDRSSVYTFRFRSHYGGRKIYGSDNVLTIVVTGGQVTYYSRNLMIPGEEDFIPEETADTPNVSFAELLSRNYASIAGQLGPSEEAPETREAEALFDWVLEQLSGIDTGYYEVSEGHRKICRPAWVLVFPENTRIFYDLYTGEYLGSIS